MNLGVIYAFAAAAVWGLVYTIDEKILHRLTPVEFLLVGSVTTTIVLFPVLARSTTQAVSLFDRPNALLLLLTIALNVLANFFIYSSIQTFGAAHASIFEISYPFFVAVLSMILLGTRLNAAFFVGSILLFAGAAIIAKFA